MSFKSYNILVVLNKILLLYLAIQLDLHTVADNPRGGGGTQAFL